MPFLELLEPKEITLSSGTSIYMRSVPYAETLDLDLAFKEAQKQQNNDILLRVICKYLFYIDSKGNNDITLEELKQLPPDDISLVLMVFSEDIIDRGKKTIDHQQRMEAAVKGMSQVTTLGNPKANLKSGTTER